MTEKQSKSIKNLRPKPITSTARAKKLGQKGGQVRSLKKKLAAQLRELKKKGATNKDIKKLVSIMEDPECSALDIRQKLDDIFTNVKMAPDTRIRLINAYIKLHYAHHGKKIKQEIKADITSNLMEKLKEVADEDRKAEDIPNS